MKAAWPGLSGRLASNKWLRNLPWNCGHSLLIKSLSLIYPRKYFSSSLVSPLDFVLWSGQL